jgi:hypothetical protein
MPETFRGDRLGSAAAPLVLAGLLLACGSARTPVNLGASAVDIGADIGFTGPDRSVRRPDAVAIEPAPALPVALARAPARGVVALREPLGDGGVRDLVLAVLDAWESESVDALLGLMTADAGPLEGRIRGRAAMIESFRQRMRAHAYGRLLGMPLLRPERIERWEYDELGLPDKPARPAEMRPGDVYVRVPMEVSRLAGEKFFEDAIVLLVRREEGRYRIAAYGEIGLPP